MILLVCDRLIHSNHGAKSCLYLRLTKLRLQNRSSTQAAIQWRVERALDVLSHSLSTASWEIVSLVRELLSLVFKQR